jgi:hypothetical protein
MLAVFTASMCVRALTWMLSKLGPQAYITRHVLASAARIEREKKIEALLAARARPQTGVNLPVRAAHTLRAGRAVARLRVTGDRLVALIDRTIARLKKC